MSEDFITKGTILNLIDQIEEMMMFELKYGTWNEDIKNNTKEAEYWKGYSYGILAFWSDFILPHKEKWESYV